MQWSLKKQNWLQTRPKCQNEQTKSGGKRKKWGQKMWTSRKKSVTKNGGQTGRESIDY